jgi:replicative DNA helicase
MSAPALDTPEVELEAPSLALVPEHHIVDDGEPEFDPRTDIETLLLGALLWSPAPAAARAVSLLVAADFQNPVAGELFTVVADLVGAGSPHGPAMVGAELDRAGKLAGHHGRLRAQRLADATTAPADPTGLGFYARAVVARTYRAGYALAAESMAQAAAELPEDHLFEHLLSIGYERRAATQRLETLRTATF